jgi:hypothetical protein
MSRVRRFLARAVFLGIGATQGGCCCPGDEVATSAVVEIRDPDPHLAALIARCTATADCAPICDAALERVFDIGDDYYVDECEVEATTTGATVKLGFETNVSCGRAPVGLARIAATDWLAHAAYLEAASVIAFVHLAADLARLGAPQRLIDAALVAATDEVRHARAIRAVAGVDVPRVRALPYRPQALFALARHNATEGCVRETIGAAINLHQARHATDATLRAVFAQIAADEIRHAELAWAIDAWARTMLSTDEHCAIDHARDEALRCVREIALPDDPRLGMPSRTTLHALVDQLV